MSITDSVLVRVVGNEIWLYSPDGELIKRFEDIVGKNHRGLEKPNITYSGDEWLLISGFTENENAISYASYLVRRLLKDGWEFNNLEEYTDGHWFKKSISK